MFCYYLHIYIEFVYHKILLHFSSKVLYYRYKIYLYRLVCLVCLVGTAQLNYSVTIYQVIRLYSANRLEYRVHIVEILFQRKVKIHC